MRRLLPCILSLLCGFAPLAGQDLNNLKFTTYTIKEGLPSNETAQMETDKDGFLWVSTLLGLSRFDGVIFKNYKGIVGDSTTLPDEGNVGLATDANGRLWVGGKAGLCYYNPVNDRFEYPFGYNNAELAGTLYMCHDKQKTLWIASASGIRQVDTEKMTLGNILYPNANIYGLLNDGAGGIWFTVIPNILGHVQGNTGQVNTWTSPGSAPALLLDKKNVLWLGSREGLSRFDASTGAFTTYIPTTLPSEEKGLFSIYDLVFCEQLTGDSVIWVSTQIGLHLFNITRQQFTHAAVAQVRNNTSLPDQQVNHLFWQPAGQLWIGTLRDGLCKMDMHDQEFKQQFVGMETSIVRAIVADKQSSNHLWVGTAGNGLLRVDLVQHKVVGQWPLPAEAAVLAIYDEGNGNVWAGTTSGLYCLNNNRLVRISIFQDNGPAVVNDIFPNPEKGYSWVLTSRGPCKLDMRTRKTTLIPMNLSSKIKNTYFFRKLVEDDQGILWVATLRGLYRVDPGSGMCRLITNPLDGSANLLNDLCMDAAGKLWLGTLNGAFIFDRQQESFQAIKIADNLAQGAVYQLLPDKNGHIWAFSDWGVSRTIREKTQFEKIILPFTYKLMSPMGGLYSIFDVNGRFTTFNKGSITAFDPVLIDQNPNTAQPLIDRFRIRNQPFPFSKETVSTQYLQLTYDQNFLSFDFTAINYTQPERMRFRYMLEGVDEGWNETDLNRTANYPQLRPGSYTFKVLAANSAGVWNEQPAIFKIKINPPWWATWWFRLLALGILAYLGYYFVQNRIKKIRQQAEIREREAGYKQREAELQREVAEFSKQVAEVELAALRAQMNPHFVFNCLNSINTFILLNDPKNASNYLNKFSKLIRRVLDASRSEYISLRDEIDTLRYYIELEQMRYGDRFQYQINIAPTLDPEALDLPPMLVQPHIENAIWHGLMNRDGDGGLLKINVDQRDHILEITVEDNGVGRKKAAELKSRSAVSHKSHGMAVTDERIKIINELYGTEATVSVTDLYDEKGNACGTRVVLHLPIKE